LAEFELSIQLFMTCLLELSQVKYCTNFLESYPGFYLLEVSTDSNLPSKLGASNLTFLIGSSVWLFLSVS